MKVKYFLNSLCFITQRLMLVEQSTKLQHYQTKDWLTNTHCNTK